MSQIQFPTATPLQQSMLNKNISAIGFLLRQLGQHSLTLNYPGPQSRLPFEQHGLRYSLIFNTLPKSGSRYVVNTLVQWLQIFSDRTAAGVFPDCHVLTELVAHNAQVPTICQDHFPARLGNLKTIADFYNRMVVHVRDPRQSMISWLHHVDKLHGEGKHHQLYFTYEQLPGDYFERDFEGKVDAQIDLYYAHAIDWLNGWLAADENRHQHGMKIKFTQFKHLKLNEEAFFKDLFEFWEMDPKLVEGKTRLHHDEKDHKRAGKLNEWMGVLTQAQIERVCDMMPDRLSQRFGWVKERQDVEKEKACLAI